jgi:hypothetical protein
MSNNKNKNVDNINILFIQTPFKEMAFNCRFNEFVKNPQFVKGKLKIEAILKDGLNPDLNYA